MKFLKQIKFELLQIFHSRFLFIMGILVIAAAVALPVIDFIDINRQSNSGGGGGIIEPLPMPIDDVGNIKRLPSDYWGNNEPIIVDGITIQPDNPFYWNIISLQKEMESLDLYGVKFSSPVVLDIVLELMDAELQYYLHFARYVTDYRDYRLDAAMQGIDKVYDKYFYENHEKNTEYLLEAASFRRGYDPESFRSKFINITPEQRLAALEEVDETIALLFDIAANNDFPKYIDLRINQERKSIEDLQKEIARLEEEIILNPALEESFNEQIEYMLKQINMIEETRIPLLQLRLEHNIIPGEDVWQNSALSDIENCENELIHTEILPEDKFYQESWLVQEYGNYPTYVEAMQSRMDELRKTIIIGRKSIESGKPDMKYVYNGARNRTVRFLSYSIFVALFAVLLGGWQMASEFQQGTIRLLMIRPRRRYKILMAKFLAAILFCLGIFALGSLLNLITNGICFGFGDFAFPNYTVEGQTGFFVYYFPKFLACTVTVIFAFATAFMLSVLARNTALAIILPIAIFIASNIVMASYYYRGGVNWLAYTPIPYIQIAYFFQQYSPVQQMIQRGIPLSLTIGIIMLLTLSTLFTLFVTWIFNKRDITN